MEINIWFWIGFNAFVVLMLALDLGVFHRKAHEVGFKEAMTWSGIWISLALMFNLGIYYYFGKVKAVEFLTGYIIEKSLSVDNIFVFVLIFSSFAVPAKYQHRVLFWGIIGALIMRAVFIFAGVALINKFHWIIYVFGVFLLYTGIKIAINKGTKINVENNRLLNLFRRYFPVTKEYHGSKFITRIEGKTWATPLMMVLILVETTDLIFAVDSIPAILAITNDPFIVYTSNVFAILGLRSLYFALAGILKYFHYLHYGLAAILVFVGIKMLITDFYKFDPFVSLGIIGFILLTSIVMSIWKPAKE
ncbi:MAG TPA: TerC family protein [Bacteroidales bacterium]|nr:TerC family protein [Bacteroidales bacterium]HOX79115.1 TerC family protein [Bacteroidales bacterium]HPM91814.1 TerC family protein [Bacteroidales bacterium]